MTDQYPTCPTCKATVEPVKAEYRHLGMYPRDCPSCGANLPPFRYPTRLDPRQAHQTDERRKDPQ